MPYDRSMTVGARFTPNGFSLTQRVFVQQPMTAARVRQATQTLIFPSLLVLYPVGFVSHRESITQRGAQTRSK